MRQRQRTNLPDQKSPTTAAEPTSPQSQQKPGVLVVDDDQLVRSLVQLGLERHGFQVWLARNGREAIDLYRAHRHDIAVVLLDVCMPGLDGPQTLDALRELDPKVLSCFMSADTGKYEPEVLRQRGAAQVIAKPFLLHELANILRRFADGGLADLRPSFKKSGGVARQF